MLDTTVALVTQRIEAMSLLAGRFADPRRLTTGYFSVVFCALDLHTGEPVAIKVLDPSLPEVRRASLLRESAILRDLRGTPGVVRTIGERFDLVVPGADATYRLTLSCFAMELCGPGLDRTPHDEGWSLARRLRAFRATCRAVQGMHAAGVVHRDLKPENVLVVPGGVVLADLGMARRLADPPMEPRDVAFLGDPRYTAPELAVRIHEPDARLAMKSDVFALGAILYEMITGRVLGDALNLSDALELLRGEMDALPEDTRAAALDDALPQLARRFPVPPITDTDLPLRLEILEPMDRLYRGLTALDHRERQTLPAADAAIDRCLARLPSERALPISPEAHHRKDLPLTGV